MAEVGTVSRVVQESTVAEYFFEQPCYKEFYCYSIYADVGLAKIFLSRHLLGKPFLRRPNVSSRAG